MNKIQKISIKNKVKGNNKELKNKKKHRQQKI